MRAKQAGSGSRGGESTARDAILPRRRSLRGSCSAVGSGSAVTVECLRSVASVFNYLIFPVFLSRKCGGRTGSTDIRARVEAAAETLADARKAAAEVEAH